MNDESWKLIAGVVAVALFVWWISSDADDKEPGGTRSTSGAKASAARIRREATNTLQSIRTSVRALHGNTDNYEMQVMLARHYLTLSTQCSGTPVCDRAIINGAAVIAWWFRHVPSYKSRELGDALRNEYVSLLFENQAAFKPHLAETQITYRRLLLEQISLDTHYQTALRTDEVDALERSINQHYGG